MNAAAFLATLALALALATCACGRPSPADPPSCGDCVPCEIRGKYQGKFLGAPLPEGVYLAFEFFPSGVKGGLYFANDTLLSPIVLNILRANTLNDSNDKLELQALFYYTEVFGVPPPKWSSLQSRYAVFNKTDLSYKESFSYEYKTTEDLAPLIESKTEMGPAPTSIDSRGPLLSVVQISSTSSEYPECQ
eukprot:CAMPEP_0177658202 /NCGR_PEP_ID=MMETSP0447-20121125/16669_1 /TAXON_ID=0 /ORGANISM="Stygamoeba regulata, Strain BSH-02190019" /LENGTH=190 /DNA_ID=CAMNT_0019162761 /DNA_START=70 /DNA_END=642 /DNA_ORIENTATION=+